MLIKLVLISAFVNISSAVFANPESFVVSCSVDSVNASDGYSSQASLLRYPNLTYIMVVIADAGIGLQAYFDGVASGEGDEYRPIVQFEKGFLFQRSEPAPLYDTNRLFRRTEISVPLDYTGFSSFETLWECHSGGCVVETLQFTASCGDPMPF